METGPGLSSSALSTVSHAVRVAQVFGVTATAFLAGQTASTTYLFIPVLLSNTNPAVLLRQWSQMLHRGHKLSPPVITALSLLFTWLATTEARPPDPFSAGSSSLLRQGLRTLPRRGRAFAVAAMVLPLVVPYTMYFLWPVNRILLAREEEQEALDAARISRSDVTIVPDTLSASSGSAFGTGSLGSLSSFSDAAPDRLAPADEDQDRQEQDEEESGDAGFGLFESTTTTNTNTTSKSRLHPLAQESVQDRAPRSLPLVPAKPAEEVATVLYQPSTFVQFVDGQVGAQYKSNDILNSHELVDRWGWLNLGRAGLVAIGAGFAAWGMVL